MKHIIKYITIFFLTALFVVSCTDMDDTYKKYVENGPIVYLSNLPGLKIQSGVGKVLISWDKQSDPRAQFIYIYWNSRHDSLRVDFTPDQTGSMLIENLEEGDYAFDIVSCDEYGHYSMTKELLSKVYGEVARSYMHNAPVDSSHYDSNSKTLFLRFGDLADSRVDSIQVRWYINGSDEVQSAALDVQLSEEDKSKSKNKQELDSISDARRSITIENYREGSTVTYWTVYKPDPTCIEFMYSNPGVYREAVAIPLVVSQLYCDKPSLLGAGIDLANLLDGKSTYFATSTDPEVAFPHNIEITLDNALPEFKFSYKARAGSPTRNPSEIDVYVKGDGGDWVFVEKLTTDPSPNSLTKVDGGSYLSRWYIKGESSGFNFDVKAVRLSINGIVRKDFPSTSGPNSCQMEELRVYK